MRAWIGLWCLALAAVGCGDDGGKRRPLGATCELGSECASGLCAENRCVDPDADEDTDGLSNALEVELGTNVFDADTDGDGSGDADELTADFAPKDSDLDGKQDAIESLTADRDLDCLADQNDKRDGVPDGAEDPRLGALCPAAVGVCGLEGAVMRVACPESLDAPECDLTGVPGFEAIEASCDAADNDCDDGIDEGCDPLLVGLVGHWRLDGDGQDAGPHGDHGSVSGATPAADRFGEAGQALRFVSPGDQVQVATTHHPDGAGDVSYSVWVRADRGQGGALAVFAFGDLATRNKGSALVLQGERHCAAYSAADNDVQSELACAPAGHWSHLVVSRAGRDVTFWLDGRLHETATLAPGQSLAASALVIGRAGDDGIVRPFAGVIDDLRVWDRAIGQSEVALLFAADDWAPVGGEDHPAQSCLHVRDAGMAPASGSYTVDTDGDGERPAFEVWCDMDLAGGGWTLAWVYGFSDFAAFDSVANAVTPIPSWPAPEATVTVSTTTPTSPTTPGAIDWVHWKDLGRAFAIVSGLADGIACEPGAGSISDGLDGWLDCDTILDTSDACQGVVPTGLFFSRLGPAIYAQDLYFYFEGSALENYPTHDPCGLNSPTPGGDSASPPANPGGALYLRETNRDIVWPAQCDYVSGLQREDGLRRIDPDGVGGLPAFEAECDFTTERGGWTRLSEAMRLSLAARPEASREYLFRRGADFYRSPSVARPWTAEYSEATGRWLQSGPDGDDAFMCQGGETGTSGIGCRDAAVDIHADSALADGSVDLCQDPPDAFGTGATCPTTEVWVREHACQPDPGSLLGDGELDVVLASAGSWQSPCWYAWGPGGWLDAFSADLAEVPPGGSGPSVRVDNPMIGNDIFAVELGQRQLTLIPGKRYTLSFWARASAPRTLRAFVQSVDLVRVHHEDIAITTEWARYEVGFEATATVWDAMVNLQLGEVSTATLWLDGFRLSETPTPR